MMGMTPPAQSTLSDETQEGNGNQDAQPRPKFLHGAVPYGVKIENGKQVTEWLLPDGRLTTNPIEADQAEYQARHNRLEHRFERRMKQNGLDPGKPEDVQRQRQIDMQSPVYAHVADLWKEAGEKYRADIEKSAEGIYSPSRGGALLGGREMHAVNASENRYNKEKSKAVAV